MTPLLLGGASGASKPNRLTKLHTIGAPLSTYFVEVDISTSQCNASDRPAYDPLDHPEYHFQPMLANLGTTVDNKQNNDETSARMSA